MNEIVEQIGTGTIGALVVAGTVITGYGIYRACKWFHRRFTPNWKHPLNDIWICICGLVSLGIALFLAGSLLLGVGEGALYLIHTYL